MGSDHSQVNSFSKEQWDLVERTDANCLWRSRKDPTLHIQQYDIYSKDSEQYQHQKESFQFRSQYPQLVSGVFFKEQQQQQFCSTNHQSSLFIEKIPIRLADVQHIPFPDCLHLYFQTLFGFQIIAGKYGYFEVQQQHIGVNEKGVVKVWLNRDFSKSYINGGKITEEQMVKATIDILDKNCDPNIPGNIPTVRNYLYRNADSLNFEQATTELRSYCISYNQGFVPEKLECIDRVGGIYAIANRLSTEGQSFATGRYSQDTRRVQPQYERPRISSQHQLESEQRISYPQSSVGQFHLKASQALPNSSRQALIVSPNAYRQNMQVIRRKRQEQPIHFIQYPQMNPMRYSQTGPQTQIVTLQSPKKAQQVPQSVQGKPSEIRFTVPQQKMIAVIGQNQSNPIHPPHQISHQATVIEPNHQQFTFKSFNQNQIDGQQHMGNTSLANFSLGPSQNSTQRDRNSLSSQPAPSPNYPSNFTLQSGHRDPSFQQVSKVAQLVQPLQQQRLENRSVRAQLVQTQKPIDHQEFSQGLRTETSQQRPPIQQDPFVIKKDQVPQPILNWSRPIKQQNLEKVASFQQSTSKPTINTHKDTKKYDISGPIALKNASQQTVDQNFKGKNYTISADDGKSSAEFMQKLRQMTQGLSPGSQLKAQANQIPTYSPNFYNQTNYSSGLNSFQPKYSYQPNVQGRNLSSEDQQFGRNAVSNIIQTQQGFSKQYSGFSSQPLKFENNLTMKYSRLEADQPSPQRKSNVGTYETELDPDLLADLKKINQS